MKNGISKKLVGMLLALLIALTAVSSLAEIQNTQPTVFAYATIESGDIIGLNYKGIYNFRGIPYATAQRFQMPQKVAAWDKARVCLTWGPIAPCVDYDFKSNPSFTQFMTPTAYNFTPSENCQNLNVWTPSMDKEAKKPVIVFLHGGGFAGGSSMELTTYDGHNISESGDIVFVSVNHRLNVLGSLDLSVYGDEYKYSGNCGMADIVASLEWVRDNISVFGGDPQNVTLVGQSGGTLKVQGLMGMPAAKGLFNKVVLQSRADDSAGATQENRRAQSDKVLEILGIKADNIAAINDIPFPDLLAAARQAGLEYGPMLDGDYYPAKEWVNGEETGISKDIPVVSSFSFGEMSDNFAPQMMGMYDGFNSTTLTGEKVMAALSACYGDGAAEIAKEFQKAYPDMDLMNALFINNHNGMLPRNDNVATIRAKNGGAPVYQVVYAMGYPIFDGVSNIHTGGDLPYLFNNVDKIDILIAGNEVDAYQMAHIASSYLCNFARTGNPNGEGLPEWPVFDLEKGYTMILNHTSEARSYHDAKLMELMETYLIKK